MPALRSRCAPLAVLLAGAALLQLGAATCVGTPGVPCPPGYALTERDHNGCCQRFTCAPTNDNATCAALGDVYYATGGFGWTSNVGWASAAAGNATDYCGHLNGIDDYLFLGDYANDYSDGTPPEGTPAVSCDPSGAVTALRLGRNQLTGTLPESFGVLKDLNNVTFYKNDLSGELPASMASLTALTYLSLCANGFSGSLPAWFGGFTSLTFMDISVNSFTGSIPPEMGNMSALEVLALDTNAISGTLPPELGLLTNLWDFTVFRTSLSGTIPDSFEGLTALWELKVYQTQLSGTLPAWLGTLTNLGNFAAGGCQFTGTLPPELGSLSILTQLQLHDNMLHGEIPSTFFNLENILNLQLQGNMLSGLMPDFNSGTTEWLEHLDLHGNQLIGSIAPSLGSLRGMTYLDLSGNLLDGPIPSSLGSLNLTVIEHVDLSSNLLSGAVPDELRSLVHSATLTTLRLDGNQLIGAVPDWGASSYGFSLCTAQEIRPACLRVRYPFCFPQSESSTTPGCSSALRTTGSTAAVHPRCCPIRSVSRTDTAPSRRTGMAGHRCARSRTTAVSLSRYRRSFTACLARFCLLALQARGAAALTPP